MGGDGGRWVATALADAWAVHGRIREPHGGGAAEFAGVRVMASGLPFAHWNAADVEQPDADVAAAGAFFAERGVPWGFRVPAGVPWRHGAGVARLRLMATGAPRSAPAVPGLGLRIAGPGDLDAVVAVDAEAFASGSEPARAWIAPQLGAPGVETALGILGGEPVATAYALRSDGRAGPAVYLAGVAVVPAARRRGIAAALSSWLLGRAFAAGARRAHLHPDDDRAARVYARLGFVEVPGVDVYLPHGTGASTAV